MADPGGKETVSEHEEETNRLFRKYLIVARHVGLYQRPSRTRDEKGVRT
ncbi:hypothetical protein [Candidatus Binatus sp.]